jgi:predicted ATPase
MANGTELTVESLGLKKPLDKMTAKELREMTMAKIPQITGATGMPKETLLAAIKDVLGIKEEEGGANPYKDQIHTVKGEIRDLRTKKAEAGTRKQKDILRRRINKLKKRTRRLAAAG